ncbi:hypothetical protein Pst134EA_027067 [Puccinia striiformis f. sp. tritici]|nr:hypothetical protein Pst134EA_027067 [Puccinia striiformis f. sp. tritici]KAH9450360.1 hypothetical protein Pst134EA_027067 [Puccinia striiformis f. sp. tritici]
MFRQAGVYNLTRTIRSILKRYRKEAPSLTMHLYSAGFRLGHKDSNLHAYDGEMKHWMDCIREQKMPNELLDVLDELGIRFYDGCLIVEVHDHRSAQQSTEQSTTDQQQQPGSSTSSAAAAATSHQRPPNNQHNSSNNLPSTSTDLANDQVSLHRLVLTPTCETLWRDILLMNESKVAQLNRGSNQTIRGSSDFQWGPITEEEAVELEAAILDRTAPALCLSPSIITSRIANQMLSETTLQPFTDKKNPRKRPLNSGEKEAMRRQRERHERFMHIADESYDQSFAPTFSRFDCIKRLRTTRPVPVVPKEPEGKWSARDLSQEQSRIFTPQTTIAPSDLLLPGYSVHDSKNESQQNPKVTGGSTSQVSSSARPQSPSAILTPLNGTATIVAPTTATTSKKNAKKKAVERSETGSPAPGSTIGATTKKAPKKPKKQVELTPEAAALAEEKRKKMAEQRKIQKERRLALAAAAKAEAVAQKASAAGGTVNNNNNPSTPNDNNNNNSAATTTAGAHAIVPSSTAENINPMHRQFTTDYLSQQGGDINISVPDSIPVMTGDSIPVPNQFGSHNNNSIPVPNLPSLSNNPSPGSNEITVHQDSNSNSSSIPVPVFNHSIPVPSSGHHHHHHNNNIPVVHQAIPVSGALQSTSMAENSIPVSIPTIHHLPHLQQHQHLQHQHHLQHQQQSSDQMASIPVPQSQQPQLWNNNTNLHHHQFTNFIPTNQHQHPLHSSSDIDINVHSNNSSHQQQAQGMIHNNHLSSSIDVPNIPILSHQLDHHQQQHHQHQQQQQQQQKQNQQQQQQYQHQQQSQQQQQSFHGWSN